MATTQRPPRRRRRDDTASDAVASPEAEGHDEPTVQINDPVGHLDDIDPSADFAGLTPPAAGPISGALSPDELGLKRWDPRRLTGTSPLTPLAILFGLNAVDELDRTAFNVLLPEIRDHFGLNLQGVLTLTSVILVVNLILELPIGYFADRKNRVRMATGGAFFWGLFSILTGVAGVMTSLLLIYIARSGSAIARNMNSTHNSLLADYYPIESRARVFYAHRFANSVGQVVGPLAAGGLAVLIGWQAPFFLLAIPTFLLIFFAVAKLREPKRGVYERLEAGADAETAETEESAAGFAETFRVLFASRTARRIYFSLPFITASALGIGNILSLFYDEVYGVGPGMRGIISATGEIAQIGGLLIGGVVVQKIMSRDPGLVMKLLAFTGLFAAACITVIAISPNVWVAVTAQTLNGAAGAILAPGIYAVISLAVPPRMRALGFATGAVWILLGAPVIPFIGAIGDAYGLRTGLLVFLPVYLVGSFLLASSGNFMNADIAKVQASAKAQAEVRRRRMEGDPQVLVVRGLDVSYDQTQVLFGVDFEVRDGEIIALLGTNGAGKSTLLKAISGIAMPDAGAIIFDGQDITSADAIQTAYAGIAQVPGGRGVFPSLTVAENIRAAGWMYRKDPEYLKQATANVLEYFPALEKRWETPAGALSGGEQQMLSLAQAFIAKPKLLMIDELSLGLAPTIVERLLDIVRAIHANGTTIILVEQSVNVALRIAKRAVFMEKGEVRFSGPTAELLERGDILRAVFLKGASAADEEGNGKPKKLSAAARKADQARRDALLEQPVVLETTGLTKRYGGITAVNQVDLQVHQGQILGLIGPNGAGKTSIFDLISGFQTVDGGSIWLDGVEVTDWPAWRRAEAGLARSFQDARLWPALTVREAIATSMKKQATMTNPLPALFGLPAVVDSEKRINQRVEELIELMGLGAFRDKFISELSTGSRRMVEIATLLSNDPKIIVLDEPSSGIAQKETEGLGPMLRQVQAYLDCSILIIEHDMPLISSLADHIVGLEQGTVIVHGTPDEVLNHPRVIESYLGTESYAELQGSDPGGAKSQAGSSNGNARRRSTRRRRTEG